MDDLIELHPVKQFIERGPVGDVALKKLKRAGRRLQVAEIALLDLGVVKIVQIIESPDLVALAEKAFADMRANEARTAGDEKVHVRKLNSNGLRVECQTPPRNR